MTTQQPRYGSPNDSGRAWRGAAYTGAGLTLAGGAAYGFGRERKRAGLTAVREGFGRSNAGQARVGAVDLDNSNTRYDGKPDGRTKAGREIRAAEREVGAGRAQRKWGAKAVSGSKNFRRGGLAALAGGAALMGAGIVGNDVARARGMKPKKAKAVPIDRGRELKALRPPSATEGSRKFAEDEATGKLVRLDTKRQQPYNSWASSNMSGKDWQRKHDADTRAKQWEEQWRKDIGDTGEYQAPFRPVMK